MTDERLATQDTRPDDMGELEGQLPNITLVPVRWDACETDEPGTHGIPRDWREDMFCETLAALGISSYGYAEEGAWISRYEVDGDCGDGLSRHYEIRTPLFVVRPFYWGDDDEVYRLPNFEWLPWHLEIGWYKWPLRDGRTNCALTDDDWRDLCSQMLAWAEAEQGDGEFELPEEDDRRSEADIWAAEWARRLRRANDATDRHWESITSLLDALSVPDADEDDEPMPSDNEMLASLQSAIDIATGDSGWGTFADEVQERLEVVSLETGGTDADGNPLMTVTIRTVRPDSGDEG